MSTEMDDAAAPDRPIVALRPDGSRPYIIVLGNEKGGTGKSTTAMNLIVALARLGYRVGSIDLDARQSSLSHYVTNRRLHAEEVAATLELPEHRRVENSTAATRGEAEQAELAALRQAFAELTECEFLVIDTPGSDSFLSRLAHGTADTLITPINDSFLDIDVLAEIDRKNRQVLAPSAYSQMVWEQNNRRVLGGQQPIDWIVLRNRLSHIEARNKREISGLLSQLAQRIGFRLAPGIGERVVYRELFLKGLTLMDLDDGQDRLPPNPSHLAGRSEIEQLLQAIGVAQTPSSQD